MTDESALDGDLLRLRGYADQLNVLAKSMVQGVKYDDANDHMGFMSLCFMSKQIEHLRSVCLLIDGHQYRDAYLISRVMIEGLARLYWAGQKSHRPIGWRAYSWVEEFRKSYGKPIAPSDKADIEHQLKTYCDCFLKPKAIGKPQSQITPYDYCKGWNWEINERGKLAEVQIGAMFEDVNLKTSYEQVYRESSNWIHWNPSAVGEPLHHEKGATTYSEETKYLGAVALITGFQSLFISSMGFDDHFQRDFSDRLMDLFKEFTANSVPSIDKSQ